MLNSNIIDKVLSETLDTYITGIYGAETINTLRLFSKIYGINGEYHYIGYKPIQLRENKDDKGPNSNKTLKVNEIFWNAYKKYNGILRRWAGGYLLFTDKFILNTEGSFFCGTEHVCEVWEELQSLIPDEEEAPSIGYITMSGSNFSSTSLPLKELKDLKIDLNYNDDLDLDRINKILKEERSSLMILHGDPGTGKTSLLRHIIAENRDLNFYWLDSKLLQMSSSKEFFDFILEHKDSIYILEDCEHLLRDREEGQNGLLSTVLNMSDGMLGDSLNVKFICTFNADLDNIDKALLRKGRLRLKYEFKKLREDKVKALSDYLGIEISEIKEMPLCDIYNYAEENGTKPKQEIRKVGFS